VSLRDSAVQEELARLKPDLIVVAAYGLILPPEVLAIPAFACVNVHASLLPRWRGAAPVQRTILAGDTHTGVSIMRMEEGLDTGAYCAQTTVAVGSKNVSVLEDELAEAGGRLLLDVLLPIVDGGVQWTEQDRRAVTYADKVKKTELRLDPVASAEVNTRRIRASSASAPARLAVQDKAATALEAHVLSRKRAVDDYGALIAAPGQVDYVKRDGKRHLVFSCADDSYFELITVKPDGRQVMCAIDWANGFPQGWFTKGRPQWG
jgi:methionyl-tRNA formyltransferase